MNVLSEPKLSCFSLRFILQISLLKNSLHKEDPCSINSINRAYNDNHITEPPILGNKALLISS